MRIARVLLLCGAFFCSFCVPVSAQDDLETFRTFQFASARVSTAWAKYSDTLRRAFVAAGLQYPSRHVYLREFKSQNEMELWARDSDTAQYRLVKTYKVCALSGSLGPKRWEGDRQVPEGQYFIEDFNPRSDFHLSLLINYPNYSDMVLGNRERPGGDIYIHGGCVTVGCLPLTDAGVSEVYVLCLASKLAGQAFIPVHIYPTRFNRQGLNFLGREYASDSTKQRFWVNLKTGYDYFEKYRKLLPVMYTPEGKYVFY